MDRPPVPPCDTAPLSEPKKRRWLPVVIGIAVCLLAAAALTAGGILWLRSQRPPASTPSDKDTTTTTALPNTVQVTVPEGYTVDKIAALLEQSGVCTADAFYEAVQTADLSEYAFAAALPDENDGRAVGRVFRLEGYLFPDTYEFYRNCSGEAALRRFLRNFENRMTPYLDQLGDRSLDEVVTLASIVQGEAGYEQDMQRVARVLQNRLDTPATYPRLQCDSGYAYLRELKQSPAGVTVVEEAYDTYIRAGLPVGAINNPGLAALTAALSPSNEEAVADCYFFATDYTTGITYYSKTYAEHVNICQTYSIGIHAQG